MVLDARTGESVQSLQRLQGARDFYASPVAGIEHQQVSTRLKAFDTAHRTLYQQYIA